MPRHQLEQFMLELVNSERAKVGAQPLVHNDLLSECARFQNTWLISEDKFQHEGISNSTPTDRIRASGYTLTGDWKTGENLAWTSPRHKVPGFQDEMLILHTNLMNSPHHKRNILDPTFREIGINFQIIDGLYQNTRGSCIVGQTFGRSGPSVFLSGVVFVDNDSDGFYDPGEGLSGVKILIESQTEKYSTVTDANGYYLIALPPDDYTVGYYNPPIDATKTMTLGDKNLKLDLIKSTVAATAIELATPDPQDSTFVRLSPAYSEQRPTRKV